MHLPRNPKGKSFSWSYSALAHFETCAFQYASQRFYETTKSEDTEATLWGTLVHKALEERVRDGKPLPDDLKQFEKWAVAIAGAQGETFCEHQFAYDFYLKPVSWFSKDAWVRGVADVMKVDRNRNKISLLDWKTGKVKNDDSQLKLFACLASAAFPEIETFNCKFIWLAHDQVTGVEVQKRELLKIWDGFYKRVQVMMEAWENQNFPCKPSGLCRGWCPVEECVHWQPKRERR